METDNSLPSSSDSEEDFSVDLGNPYVNDPRVSQNITDQHVNRTSQQDTDAVERERRPWEHPERRLSSA